MRIILSPTWGAPCPISRSGDLRLRATPGCTRPALSANIRRKKSSLVVTPDPDPPPPAAVTVGEPIPRAAELSFRLLVDAVHDCAIYMLDPDGRIVSWN